ncbi:fimbria/pilus outer membrane usher protein [Utexia brackfieldae]|uniref:fimbria/pilus outer membrane usher protein n=1 Tax=Utexia brackfieldae TaxID=3074108 RepID=UPI00370DCC34
MFLGGDVASLQDLSYLAGGNTVTPGIYYLDLSIGERFVKNIQIKFAEDDDGNKKVSPCFTKSIVDIIPFNKVLKKEFELETQSLSPDACIDIAQHIPGFDYSIDLANLSLNLSIPQIYLDSVRSTLAKEADWDDGIPALITNYNINGSNSWNKHSDNYSYNYIGLSNRLNVGPWRFNGNVYWTQSRYGNKTTNDTRISNVYATRDFREIKSRLTVGQNSIGSNLFDSLPYIGATVTTADEMLPDSERGYSPPIKGVANSRSKLVIRQNGLIVYQTFVDPGPYDITDLNPVGSSGDYEVELTAADGSVSKYIIPYSTLPNLLKLGGYNYSATLGQLDIRGLDQTRFVQLSGSMGLPLQTTLYGGAQISAHYNAIGLGIAKDFGGFGAMSFDAVNSITDLGDRGNDIGQSYRILYAKSFNETGTNLQLTGYRYSTSGYYTFNEAAFKKRNKFFDPLTGEYSNNYSLAGRMKSSYQWSIAQSLGQLGQVALWGNVTSYWGGGTAKNLQVSWNKTLEKLNNLLVSISYNKYTYDGSANDLFYFYLTMPLSTGDSRRGTMYASNSFLYNKTDKSYSNSTSLYGSALDDDLNYNIYQTVNKDSRSNVTNLSANYKADMMQVNAGLSYSEPTTQINYGITGSALLHYNGFVFGREASDTAILVEAKGAEGAKINQVDKVTINKDGYALIPYSTPYHYNDVELDPVSFGNDFDIDTKILKVAPTRGAITKVVFDVRSGYNFLVLVKHNNKPILFGTMVTNTLDNSIAVADDDGTVYLSGVKDNTKYTVKLGENNICSFTINYGADFKADVVNKLDVDCL